MRWMVVVAAVVAGCSSNSNTPSDAIRHRDAAPDAPSGEPVSLRVMKDGVPQAGVTVFIGDDGYLEPGIALTTDADGTVTAYVENGFYHNAVVTAVNPFGALDANTDELFTFTRVKYGDELQLVRTTPVTTTVTLTFPTNAGAASYRAHTTCGSGPITPGGALQLLDCGAAIDVLIESRDASGAILGWLYAPSLATASALSLTGTYQPSTTRRLSFDTHNVISSSLAIRSRIASANGIVYDVSSTLGISYMNHMPTHDVVLPPIPNAITITEVAFRETNYAIQRVVDWYPSEETQLPPIDLSQGGLLSYASPITWTLGGLQYTYTGGVFPAHVLRANVELNRVSGRGWQWHLVAPYWSSNGSVRWPTLPVNDWTPRSGDTSRVLEATLFSVPGEYDGIRANAFSIDPSVAIRPTAGRLYYATP